MPRLGDIEHIRNTLKKFAERISDQEAVGLNDKTAQAIVDALRFGTAPINGAALLAVGREQLIKIIHQDLDRASTGKSSLRILNGHIGMGKTLTLRILQDYAFRLGFATSFVTLTSRECPLYDMGAVYRHIVKGLRVNDCRDRAALEWILENWANRVRDDVRRTSIAPWSFWELSLPFKEVLAIYFEAVFHNYFVRAEKALSWINGDMRAIQYTREMGVHTVITSDNALEMLGNITRMVRELGLRGLVILLDEAETIPSICTVARSSQAIRNLDMLAGASGRTPYSYFVYATTPYFLEYVSNTGIRMNILHERLITLENLNGSELFELALKIKEIYLYAYGWQGDSRTKDANLKKLVFACLGQQKVSVTPRLIVRSVVKCMDLCYDSPEVNFNQIMNSLLKTLNTDNEN
jgi:hypothetical protein